MHLNNDENLFLLPYCSYPFAWPAATEYSPIGTDRFPDIIKTFNPI